MDPQDELPIDFQRETAALRRVARGILFEPALAEDAVQEAWLAALRSQPGTRPTGGWLNEAVRRIASGMRRGAARRDRRERAGARIEALPSAAETAERVELLRELLDALASLDEPYRSAVQMRLVDDLPPRAIAERLGVPVETARTRVKRGISELRARLDAKNAGRRGEFLAVLAPLADFAHAGLAAGALGGAKTIGGWIVGTKTKLAAAAAIVAATCVLLSRPWEQPKDEPRALANAVSTIENGASSIANERSAVPVPAPLAGGDETSSEAERQAAVVSSEWTLRGRARRGRVDPFPGATVEVRVVRGYEGQGEQLYHGFVTCDAEGAFAVGLPPPDSAVRVELRAKTEAYVGFRVERLVLRGAPAPKDLLLVLYPLDVLVRGIVLDPEGAPIPSASINAIMVDTTCGNDGRFELRSSSLMELVYVTAHAEAFAETQTVVRVGGKTEIDGVEIRLERSVLLRGRVRDADGLPIAEAVIEGPSFVQRNAKTDADGRFVLDGLRENEEWLALWIDAPGFVRLRRNFPDRKIPVEEIEFVLERGLEVTGRVVDTSGTALPGALVHAGDDQNHDPSTHAIAGDDGRFVLRRVDRATRACGAVLDGFAPAVRQIELPARGVFTGEVVITLDRGLTVRGLVVDEAGDPVPKAAVYMRAGHDYIESVNARADSEGRFEVVGIPPRDRLAFEVTASGHVRVTTAFDPDSRTPVRIVLPRGAGLAGVVLDAATKQPIQRFRVRFVPGTIAEGGEPLSGYNAFWTDPGIDFDDAQGRWETKNEELVAGEVTGLEVSAPGYGPAIVARAVTTLDYLEQRIVVELGRGARVTGRVVDAQNGRAIAGAVVWRTTTRDPLGPWEAYTQRSALQAKTNEQGEFAFDGLPIEPMKLYVDVAGYAPAVDGPFDAGVENAPRKLEVHRGATLRGRLLDSKGVALANEPVQVSRVEPGDRPGRDWSLVTDRAGGFEVADLAPGKYTAMRELRWEMGATYDLSASIEITEAGEYELELRPGGTGRVVGTIPGAAHRDSVFQVSATRVEKDAGGQSLWRSALAREGRFELDGLEAGRWKLIVEQVGAGRAARHGVAEVDVVDGKEAAVEVAIGGP